MARCCCERWHTCAASVVRGAGALGASFGPGAVPRGGAVGGAAEARAGPHKLRHDGKLGKAA